MTYASMKKAELIAVLEQRDLTIAQAREWATKVQADRSEKAVLIAALKAEIAALKASKHVPADKGEAHRFADTKAALAAAREWAKDRGSIVTQAGCCVFRKARAAAHAATA
jgi:hypothetical protein